MTTLKDVLNRADLNTLSYVLQTAKFGDVVRSLPVHIYRIAANQAPTDQITAVHSYKLPDDCKASFILRATAIAGSGTAGPLTVDASPMVTAPAAGHVNVTQSGDLAFAAADAWTSVDVLYVPLKLDVVSYTGPVVAASGIMTLPVVLQTTAVAIYEATANIGTTTGPAAVIAQATAVPTTTHQVNFNGAKSQVQFRIADAVTSATVKLGVIPGTNLNSLLGSSL